jgi:hypothetical protein
MGRCKMTPNVTATVPIQNAAGWWNVMPRDDPVAGPVADPVADRRRSASIAGRLGAVA